MRVISGKYKGKSLEGYDVIGTRPTMDRVKESLFGTIQNYVKDSISLDLFAGSGGLGIEALSNGGKICYFVDNGREIKKFLQANLKGIEGATYLDYDYKKALQLFKEQGMKFDIIFLDPPYQEHLINSAIELIKEYDLLAINGIVICEYVDEEIKDYGYQLLKNKKYGDKYIDIYKYVN